MVSSESGFLPLSRGLFALTSCIEMCPFPLCAHTQYTHYLHRVAFVLIRGADSQFLVTEEMAVADDLCLGDGHFRCDI